MMSWAIILSRQKNSNCWRLVIFVILMLSIILVSLSYFIFMIAHSLLLATDLPLDQI